MLLLIGALALTFLAIVLDQGLRRHRLPNHNFLLSIEIVDPSIYDPTGRRLLVPAIAAWIAALVAWFAVVVR